MENSNCYPTDVSNHGKIWIHNEATVCIFICVESMIRISRRLEPIPFKIRVIITNRYWLCQPTNQPSSQLATMDIWNYIFHSISIRYRCDVNIFLFIYNIYISRKRMTLQQMKNIIYIKYWLMSFGWTEGSIIS